MADPHAPRPPSAPSLDRGTLQTSTPMFKIQQMLQSNPYVFPFLNQFLDLFNSFFGVSQHSLGTLGQFSRISDAPSHFPASHCTAADSHIAVPLSAPAGITSSSPPRPFAGAPPSLSSPESTPVFLSSIPLPSAPPASSNSSPCFLSVVQPTPGLSSPHIPQSPIFSPRQLDHQAQLVFNGPGTTLNLGLSPYNPISAPPLNISPPLFDLNGPVDNLGPTINLAPLSDSLSLVSPTPSFHPLEPIESQPIVSLSTPTPPPRPSSINPPPTSAPTPSPSFGPSILSPSTLNQPKTPLIPAPISTHNTAPPLHSPYTAHPPPHPPPPLPMIIS